MKTSKANDRTHSRINDSMNEKEGWEVEGPTSAMNKPYTPEPSPPIRKKTTAKKTANGKLIESKEFEKQLAELDLDDDYDAKKMADKGVVDLQTLRELCQEAEVKFIACQMTVDLFDFTQDDFLDGIEYGGAATFFEFAGESDICLFI